MLHTRTKWKNTISLAAVLGTALCLPAAGGQVPTAPLVPAPLHQSIQVEWAPYFAPPIKPPDVPLMAQELSLDKKQVEILEQLVRDYLQEFEQSRERYIKQLNDAGSPDRENMDPEWKQRDQQRNDLIKEATRKSKSDRDRAIRDSINSEIESARDVEQIRSKRTSLIRAWMNERDAAWNQLLADIVTALAIVINDPDNAGHWPAVERALRRRNTPWRPKLYAEDVAFGQILLLKWGRESPVYRDVYGPMLKYSVEYDKALRNRDDVIERMQLQFMDARDAKAPRPWIDATSQEVDARYELWKVNERHLDLIVEAMPVGDGLRFRRMALEQMYPDIYETHRFEHAVEYVQDNVPLTESQEAGLSDLLWSYQDELEPLCEERVRIVHEWDPGRLISNTKDSVGLSCYGFMESVDLSHLTWLEANNAARKERFDLDREYLKRLESLLTPKVFAALPQHALRAGFGDFRRGPVPDVDPRDMGVVYMKSPGDPIQEGAP